MAIQVINIGTTADDGKGDTLRVAMQKINDNTTELYGLLGQDTAGAKGIDISGSTIATTETNADITLSPNGTGAIVLGAMTVSGTTLSAADSSAININENVVIDGDLDVTGTITGTFSTSSIGDISAVGSTLSTPSNADFDLTPGGTGNVNLNGDTVRVGDNDANATITTQGTGDLTLSTNSGTNSGTITIADGANGDITIENNGTGDILLKAGGQVGIGDVSSPDTSLHIKQANAILTLQRTNDTGTPGIDFQQAGGNVRAQIYMDGTNGISKELIFKVQDGTLDERFRVTKSGASVTGTFNIMSDNDSTLSDATISITQNEITTLRSNDNLVLSANGTGTVQTTSNLHLLSATPIIQIQRTDNANVPGLSFLGDAGTEGASIKFDGTSGTANELIFKTFTVSGGLIERFRVQQGGASVTGTLTIDDGITITDNTITSSASNADLELTAAGTGTVKVLGTLDIDAGITITDNTITTSASNANLELTAAGTGAVKVDAILSLPDGSSSDNYVGLGDADDLKIFHNGSHSIVRETGTGSLYLQSDNNVILGKDTGGEIGVKVVADGAVELYHDNVKKFETTSGGVLVTGTLDIDSLNLLDNKITTDSNANLELTPGGTGTIVMPGITVDDNEIQANRSNDDLVLSASGTGSITAQSSFTFNAGYIEKINTLTSSSTITVDCSLASIHKVTLATNTEFNITSLPTGGSVTLIITQDGSGSRTASFGSDTSTAIKFPGGAPTLSTGAADIDVVTIVNDGTNFLGNCAKNYS